MNASALDAANPELETFYAFAGNRNTNAAPSGTVLFKEGERGDRLFALVSGEIELTLNGRTVEVITPGSCFGIEALVSASHLRFNTATASVDSEYLEMDRAQFLFALQELPMFGLEILWDAELRIRNLQSISHPGRPPQ